MDGKEQRKMIGTAALMAGIIFLSKILGLLRDILIASSYGTSQEAIAYETASRLPILVFDLVIGGVVTAAFVPVFNEILVKNGKNKAFSFANTYIDWILILTTAISLLGFLFAPQLVVLLAPDIDNETAELASVLTRIMFPMIIGTGLAFSFVGILQSLGEFTIPAIISLVSNGIMVFYLLTINRFLGIIGLAVAMLVGWISQAFIQIPKLNSLGYRFSPKATLFSSQIKYSAFSALPILVTSWTQPICSIINMRHASSIEEGRAITALGYSNKLFVIIVGIFSFVATNLLFPRLAKSNAEGNKEGERQLILSSTKILIFILTPITLGLFLLATPFIAVVYQHGEFTSSDTLITADAMRMYALGMVFMAVNEVLTKSFFAEKKPFLPMITSLISLSINILLIQIFKEKLGIGEIALISGISILLNCLFNFILAKRNGLITPQKEDWVDVGKTILSSFIMGSVVLVLSEITKLLPPALILLICIPSGVLIYLLIAFLLKSDEIKILSRVIMNKDLKHSSSEDTHD